MVHIKIEDIIPEFIESECELGDRLREEVKRGMQVSEQLLVEMIAKRIQYSDCVRNGFMLEDYPKTQSQAKKITELGIVPDFVFYLDMKSEYCYSRVEKLSATEFMYENRVISERLTKHLLENPGVMGYYENKFGNVQYINGLKSKWFVEEKILSHIRNSTECKSTFSRNILNKTKACALQYLNVDRSLYTICLSGFKYFCTVTWKHHQTFSDSKYMSNTAVLYQPSNSNLRNLYYFRTLEQRDIFLQNPESFSDIKLFTSEIPHMTDMYNAAQIISKEKNLANYCPVTLYEDGKVEKGYQLYLALYKEHKFIFETSAKLNRFMANPVRYSKVTLPVKIPPVQEKISLLTFAENDDSIPFLEQSIGSIATRGLLEITSLRMKYPTLSVKETSLKLFALFLKANNPSNTEYSRKKYQKKVKQFVERCNLPLKIDKMSGKEEIKGIEEKHYHELGARFDKIMMVIKQERSEDFINYIR